MATLQEGMLFSSYEELKAKIDEFSSQNSLSLSVKNSRTIEGTKKKLPGKAKHLNDALKYYELSIECSDCVKNKSWIKKVTDNVEVNSKMNIRVCATRNGQHLEIRRIDENHNHPVGQTANGPKNTEHCSKAGLGQKRPGKTRGKTGTKTSNEVHTGTDTDTPSPKRKRNKSLPDSVNLGTQIERWQRLRKDLNLDSDEEFAEVLLNRLEQDFENQTSSEAFPAFVPRVGAEVTASEMDVDTGSSVSQEAAVDTVIHLPDHEEQEDTSGSHENDKENLQTEGASLSSLAEIATDVITQFISGQGTSESPSFLVQGHHRESTPLHTHGNNICENGGPRLETVVELGKQYERWKQLKQKLKIETDEGMAKFLIDTVM